jgi:hypothetical protein
MLRAGKQSGSPFAIAALEHGLPRRVHAGMAKMFGAEGLLSLINYERWQDAVLAAGNVFFCFTLIPMLRHPVRPPLLTCIPTGLALLIGDLCLPLCICGLRQRRKSLAGFSGSL